MKHQIHLVAALAFTLGAAGAAHGENAMYSCTGTDGGTSLTNVPVNDHCARLFDYTPPVASAPAAPQADTAPATAAPALAPAPAAPAPAAIAAKKPQPADAQASPRAMARAQLGNVLAGRRNAAIQEMADAYARGQPATAVNPAVNRRYLMTNRADYIKANGTPQ